MELQILYNNQEISRKSKTRIWYYMWLSCYFKAAWDEVIIYDSHEFFSNNIEKAHETSIFRFIISDFIQSNLHKSVDFENNKTLEYSLVEL